MAGHRNGKVMAGSTSTAFPLLTGLVDPCPSSGGLGWGNGLISCNLVCVVLTEQVLQQLHELLSEEDWQQTLAPVANVAA